MSGNKSADICKMIRNASTQGWCLRLLAGERGDEAICREIEDQQERRFCLENVKKGPIAIRGDGIMEEIEFDCSAIFPDCDAGWLDENLSEPENTQKISAYCKDRCLEIFRRAGGYGTITGSSNITCGCS